MGILALQFFDGQSLQSPGLTGFETFDILRGPGETLQPRQVLTVRAVDAAGAVNELQVLCRIDTPVEAEYYGNGGILQTVLRHMMNV